MLLLLQLLLLRPAGQADAILLHPLKPPHKSSVDARMLTVSVTSDAGHQYTVTAVTPVSVDMLLLQLWAEAGAGDGDVSASDRARFAEELAVAVSVSALARGERIVAAARLFGTHVAFQLANETLFHAAWRAVRGILEGSRPESHSIVDTLLREAHHRLRFALGFRDGKPALADAADASRHARTLLDVAGVPYPLQLQVVVPDESVAEGLAGFITRTGYQLDAAAADRAALRLLLAGEEARRAVAGSQQQQHLAVSAAGRSVRPHAVGCSRAIVVARYREDVTWLASLGPDVARDVWLYDKGGQAWEPPAWALAAFRAHLPQPNVGREAHSYLRFIVDHYDAPLQDRIVDHYGSVGEGPDHEGGPAHSNNAGAGGGGGGRAGGLPDLIVFTQARVDDHLSEGEFAALLRGQQRPLDAFGGWELGVPAGLPQQWLATPPDAPTSSPSPSSVGGWWAATLPDVRPRPVGMVPVAWGAVFCATRAQVHSVPKAAYERLLDQVSVGANPEVAYMLERAWVHLLGAASCNSTAAV